MLPPGPGGWKAGTPALAGPGRPGARGQVAAGSGDPVSDSAARLAAGCAIIAVPRRVAPMLAGMNEPGSRGCRMRAALRAAALQCLAAIQALAGAELVIAEGGRCS